MIFPSRSQLIRELSLTRTEQMEISKRRGDPHRLGFAYQFGFVRARDVYYGRHGRISARELHEQMTSCRARAFYETIDVGSGRSWVGKPIVTPRHGKFDPLLSFLGTL